MILIIDNYDSFTWNLVHLVARGTDEVRVVRNDEWSIEDIRAARPDGILISPGPGRPVDAGITCDVIRTFSGSSPSWACVSAIKPSGKFLAARSLMRPD